MFTEEDNLYMHLAIQQAKLAVLDDEVPVGAIMVIQNEIVAQDYNKVQQLEQATAHAELLVIQMAMQKLKKKYLTDATIYCTLEPCLMCVGALHWCKIKKIIYAASDKKNGYLKYIKGIHPFHPKTIIQQGLMAKESQDLLQNFFREKRRKLN